jgi:hypothetical protein
MGLDFVPEISMASACGRPTISELILMSCQPLEMPSLRCAKSSITCDKETAVHGNRDPKRPTL